ncbi:MAG: VacJ family lipoprotein [Proteobacteria bacterium]|nr:VacJ family lipoprotein [Pseudomonadota bacterium]
MSKIYLDIFRRMAELAIAGAMLGLLNGCATSGLAKDPLEGYNRAMFAFNDGLDRAIVKPIAQGYVDVVPAPVRTGVANFYGNIADVFIAANNLLQGKLPEAVGDVGRVAINSTVGLLGVLDIASDLGLEKHDEDFGQTFGRWGVGAGPYVMLPIMGPRTLRDAFAQILDTRADPVAQLEDVPTRNSLLVVRGISDRADYLAADKIVQEAALDRYAYIRDAYLQRRRSKVYDGNAPRLHDE